MPIRKDTNIFTNGGDVCGVLNRLRRYKKQKNKKTRFVQRFVFFSSRKQIKVYITFTIYILYNYIYIII